MKKMNWKNKIVLGVNAHPDDLDFVAGGTLAKAAKAGAEVYYVIFTSGNKGNAGNPKLSASRLVSIRKKEQTQAAKILGIKKVFFLNHNDSELEANLKTKKELVKLIRKLKPNVVFGLDPSRYYSSIGGFVNHTDHRAAGEITIDACYPMCRDRLCMPDAGPPHKVGYLFLATFDDANYFEDISKTIDIKTEALQSHKSQIADFNNMSNWVRDLSKKIGKKSKKHKFAECFRVIDLTQF